MSSDEFFFEDFEDTSWWEPTSLAVRQPTKLCHVLIHLQDDLVERTFHSPVYISYNQALDFLDGYDSDVWDSDDGFEDALSTHSQPTHNQENTRPAHSDRGGDLNLSRSRVPVIWRPSNWRFSSPDVPSCVDGENERVALLQDWRIRLAGSNANATCGRPEMNMQNPDDAPKGDAPRSISVNGNAYIDQTDAKRMDSPIPSGNNDLLLPTKSDQIAAERRSSGVATKVAVPPVKSPPTFPADRKRKATKALEIYPGEEMNARTKRGRSELTPGPKQRKADTIHPQVEAEAQWKLKSTELESRKKPARGRPRNDDTSPKNSQRPNQRVSPRRSRREKR